MSISNLLVPNNYNIYVGSISTSEGGGPLPIEGKLTVTNKTSSGTGNITIDQVDITSPDNDIAFTSNGTGIFYVGENPVNNDSYVWAQDDFKIGTNFTERLRISQAGIALDNTATSILAQQGTVLVSRNNIVDTSSTQTLTNKTINSGSNTIIAGGVTGSPNLNTVLTQDVSKNGNPVFQSIALNSSLTLCNIRNGVHGSIPANGTTTIYNFVLPVNQSVVVSYTISAHCLTGANQGYSDLIFDYKLVNNGTVVGSAGNNAFSSEDNITGAYAGNLSTNILVTGGNVINVQLVSTLATGAITYGGYVEVCYA